MSNTRKIKDAIDMALSNLDGLVPFSKELVDNPNHRKASTKSEPYVDNIQYVDSHVVYLYGVACVITVEKVMKFFLEGEVTTEEIKEVFAELDNGDTFNYQTGEDRLDFYPTDIAWFVSKPVNSIKRKPKVVDTIAARVTPEFKQKVEEYCRHEDTTISALVTFALEQVLKDSSYLD